MPITWQERTIRFVQGTAQHTILHGATIDEEKLLTARSTMQGGFGNRATHLQVRGGVGHGQYLLVEIGPKEHLQALSKVRRSGRLEVQAAVQMQGHMYRWRCQGQRAEAVRDMTGLRGGLFEEFEACWGIVEQIADPYGCPRRRATGCHVQHG